ncbi:8-amino-7-oxononanoate synthase [Cellvibrio polysaccharolyticus]|uniref:8-amino-7-oxononanoate synthase n=1 Tax=Cellvibrio polysaccharolyticus TaxID=2082724 RepID=A0A928V8S8_9GAMM|nr:8-amino-7-oxononanoate synthase [Cellvibrio polysaccharolyticus]MBE8718817.1 8-amino-7-oxononanoate synthase [Cellvibrio polysaccharolyticus]
MSTTPDSILLPALQQRRAEQRYRHRRTLQTAQTPLQRLDGQQRIAFCSNDYLGLANHPEVIAAFQQAAAIYGVGSGASHLVNGHSAEHQALEEELAAFCGRQRALLFSTGYMANMGVISALVGRGDAVLEDRLNHASLLDGGLLSGARFQRFAHNDVEQLSSRLARTDAQRKLVAVDGVFSMDGDLAPLDQLATCCQAHQAWLMVDDAHGFGCLGERGAGVVEHFGLGVNEVPVLMATLGKAMGTAGAFVAGSETLIETLIQFSRPYIYTTAMPPAVAAATRASLKVLQAEPWRRQHLNALIKHFREGASRYGLALEPSMTAIQPVILGDEARALAVSAALEARGFLVIAIRPPTVPAGSSRLRITLSAAHTVEQVDALLAALVEVLQELPPSE